MFRHATNLSGKLLLPFPRAYMLDDAVAKGDVVALVRHGEATTVTNQYFNIMIRSLLSVPLHLMHIERINSFHGLRVRGPKPRIPQMSAGYLRDWASSGRGKYDRRLRHTLKIWR